MLIMKPSPSLDQNEEVSYLLERIASLRNAACNDQRVLIAVAGGPGSGKSTLCARLLQHAQDRGIYDVAAVPMVSDFNRATSEEGADMIAQRMDSTFRSLVSYYCETLLRHSHAEGHHSRSTLTSLLKLLRD